MAQGIGFLPSTWKISIVFPAPGYSLVLAPATVGIWEVNPWLGVFFLSFISPSLAPAFFLPFYFPPSQIIWNCTCTEYIQLHFLVIIYKWCGTTAISISLALLTVLSNLQMSLCGRMCGNFMQITLPFYRWVLSILRFWCAQRSWNPASQDWRHC